MRTTTIKQFQASSLDLEAIRKIAGNDSLCEADVFDFGTFIIARSGVNRNHCDITPEGQKAAVKEWIGKAILFRDHESNASNQIGRIYEAWTEDRPNGETVTLGKGYGVKTDDLADVFKRIENGVHREMSCAYEPTQSVCSQCSADLIDFVKCPNGHSIGVDAYARDVAFVPDHISFVARPAVVGAGLIAAADQERWLRVFASVGETPAEAEQTLRTLQRDADDGKAFRAWAQDEFSRWYGLANPSANDADIQALAEKLTAKEMISLGQIEKQRFHEVMPLGGNQVSEAPKQETETPVETETVSLKTIADAMKG